MEWAPWDTWVDLVAWAQWATAAGTVDRSEHCGADYSRRETEGQHPNAETPL